MIGWIIVINSIMWQVADLHARLDQAEASALKGGKKIMHKLEQRITELEGELEHEQKSHQETLKEVRKNERRIRELATQTEEERKTQFRLQETVSKLESKLKHCRRQKDETEEIASMNLAKLRAVKCQFDEATERAELAESTTRFTTKVVTRSSVSMGRVSSPVVSKFLSWWCRFRDVQLD